MTTHINPETKHKKVMKSLKKHIDNNIDVFKRLAGIEEEPAQVGPHKEEEYETEEYEYEYETEEYETEEQIQSGFTKEMIEEVEKHPEKYGITFKSVEELIKELVEQENRLFNPKNKEKK